MPLVWEWMHDIENLDLIGLYFLKQMMMMILFFLKKKKKKKEWGMVECPMCWQLVWILKIFIVQQPLLE